MNLWIRKIESTIGVQQEIGKSQTKGPPVLVGNKEPCFNPNDVVHITDMTSNVNKSLSKSIQM